MPLMSELLALSPLRLLHDAEQLGAVRVPTFERGLLAPDQEAVFKIPVVEHAMQTATGAAVWPSVYRAHKLDGAPAFRI